ncbi:hypothetical protein ABXK61_12950 [Burkholderia sola]|uniref:hypothetical protein n=1 Tax=Burkholderia TaxID=32008 RepID=UPI001AE6A7EE|nr:hypothetical protein [Burkholderia sp. AcTa6-5]MBP0714220.1 hypothetical protein [Burkholderia sp. AcTa6-5]
MRSRSIARSRLGESEVSPLRGEVPAPWSRLAESQARDPWSGRAGNGDRMPSIFVIDLTFNFK